MTTTMMMTGMILNLSNEVAGREHADPPGRRLPAARPLTVVGSVR
jgi:hypothetical protein